MKKIKYIPFILLIIINITTICLVIELSNYDELAAYMRTGDIKYSSPKKTAWIIFLALVFNLFFVCITLMKEIMFPRTKAKKNESIDHL